MLTELEANEILKKIGVLDEDGNIVDAYKGIIKDMPRERCSCYTEEARIEPLSDFERGILTGIKSCKELTSEQEHELNTGCRKVYYARCNGTREREICDCGGNTEYCTFYPEKRGR